MTKKEHKTYDIDLWPISIAAMVIAMLYFGYSCPAPGECKAPVSTSNKAPVSTSNPE